MKSRKANDCSVKLWAGVGFGLDFRRNRYGMIEYYFVIPFIRIRLNKPNPYYG